MINVGELMTDPDFVRSFSIKRPAGGSFAEGVFTPSYVDMAMVGIVQPASLTELQLLPEGSRLGDVISVWRRQELRAGDGAKLEPDVVIVDGKRYRVLKCEPWPDGGYFRVLAEGYVT